MMYVEPTEIPAQRIVWLVAGDIIVVRSGAYTGDSAIIPSGFGACIAGFDMVLRCQSARPEFVQYALLSKYLKEGQIDVEKMRAAQPHLNAEELGSCLLVLPDTNEQDAIVSFLDRETAKIDALVAEQQRLIELLTEKRQAVISHAVTKGLNPNVPTKPSGVDWLGEIPAHWRVGPIKYFVLAKSGSIKTGPFGSQLTSADMQSGTIKVYNQRSVIDGNFESGENFISDEKFAELASFEAFPGDILVTTRGTIGRAAILPPDAERGILHPCLLRLQPDNSLIGTLFLKTLIQDSDLLKAQLSYLSNATTIEVIYSHTMASVVIPVPPLSEQSAIMEFLLGETEKLNNLIQEAQRGIELLGERRTALVSAAVTGQIDVRAIADRAAA